MILQQFFLIQAHYHSWPDYLVTWKEKNILVGQFYISTLLGPKTLFSIQHG